MYRSAGAPARSILVVAGSASVAGYDRETGSLVWSIGVPGAEDAVPGAIEIEVHDSRVYVLTRERLGCFDYFSGGAIAAAELGEPAASPTLLIDGGHVYVGAGRWLECYTLECELRWRTARSPSPMPSPALAIPGKVRQADET